MCLYVVSLAANFHVLGTCIGRVIPQQPTPVPVGWLPKKKTAKSKKWRQWRPSNLVFPREGSAAHFTRALRCNRVYGYQKGSQADFKDGAALYLAGESKFVARNFFFPDPCPFSASFTNQHANSKWGHVKRLV